MSAIKLSKRQQRLLDSLHAGARTRSDLEKAGYGESIDALCAKGLARFTKKSQQISLNDEGHKRAVTRLTKTLPFRMK